MNYKRGEADRLSEEALDTQACIIEARLAQTEAVRWQERAQQALARVEMHNRGLVARTEAMRRQQIPA